MEQVQMDSADPGPNVQDGLPVETADAVAAEAVEEPARRAHRAGSPVGLQLPCGRGLAELIAERARATRAACAFGGPAIALATVW
jgi:hypothetical protein